MALLLPIVAIRLPLVRGILSALRRQSRRALVVPVALYSLVLSAMLFSAWATLFRPEWTPLRRGIIVLGASLFFTSDVMLAWNRFVKPLRPGRVGVMIFYHLGQMALAASIAL